MIQNAVSGLVRGYGFEDGGGSVGLSFIEQEC